MTEQAEKTKRSEPLRADDVMNMLTEDELEQLRQRLESAASDDLYSITPEKHHHLKS